ncbi:unnamed protein product, partial [marine sediment metagenome]
GPPRNISTKATYWGLYFGFEGIDGRNIETGQEDSAGYTYMGRLLRRGRDNMYGIWTNVTIDTWEMNNPTHCRLMADTDAWGDELEANMRDHGWTACPNATECWNTDCPVPCMYDSYYEPGFWDPLDQNGANDPSVQCTSPGMICNSSGDEYARDITYNYVGGLEEEDNHGTAGINVLYVDGHTEQDGGQYPGPLGCVNVSSLDRELGQRYRVYVWAGEPWVPSLPEWWQLGGGAERDW